PILIENTIKKILRKNYSNSDKILIINTIQDEKLKQEVLIDWILSVTLKEEFHEARSIISYLCKVDKFIWLNIIEYIEKRDLSNLFGLIIDYNFFNTFFMQDSFKWIAQHCLKGKGINYLFSN